MTSRAVETLRACDAVLAEDTRRTRHLLTHFAVAGKSLERLDAHATQRDIARVVERMRGGERLALVTDAGTPTVSDPGQRLIDAAAGANVRVIPIPGASAVLAALVASGLSGDGRFRFMGFLPREGRERRDAIAAICSTAETVVLFEAPSRVRATLQELADATPDRRACVARELTKVHEELTRGTLSTLVADERQWVGEIAIVLGPHASQDREALVDASTLDARIDEALSRGEHARTISERLAAWCGRPKREIYARVLERKKR